MDSMHAIRIHSYGGPDVLSYEDVPIPTPGPGEARIKIAASGVNFIDIYQRSGQYKGQLPFIPGNEAAGIVDSIGADVQEVQVGDRVAYAQQLGSYAEYAIVPAGKLVPVPADIDLTIAAAVMLQGLTAHYLTASTYPLKPGDTAIVHAAAGGVGLLLTQLAKLRGATVIGTVSTAEKAQFARAAGADEVTSYTEFAEVARRMTNGRGVDVVYESVGKDTFDQSLGTLRPRGYLILYGQSSGAVPPLDPQILNAKGSLFLTRPTLGHYVQDRAELLARAGELFDLIAAGRLNVRIDRSYPLAEASAAHTALASRATSGKVLLTT
ncbi:MAG: quinone oxidoreductase [Roseiflexaceae bacterium]|nr:quinone oxidoreductase [Roseiflexaceae bacterium]